MRRQGGRPELTHCRLCGKSKTSLYRNEGSLSSRQAHLLTEANAFTRNPLVLAREFLDFQGLIYWNVAEKLAGVTDRPVYLDGQFPRAWSKADVLLEWRCSERAATADGAI